MQVPQSALVADFEEHHTLQGFRKRSRRSGYANGRGTIFIADYAFQNCAIGERYTVLPQARHLEVDRLAAEVAPRTKPAANKSVISLFIFLSPLG